DAIERRDEFRRRQRVVVAGVILRFAEEVPAVRVFGVGGSVRAERIHGFGPATLEEFVRNEGAPYPRLPPDRSLYRQLGRLLVVVGPDLHFPVEGDGELVPRQGKGRIGVHRTFVRHLRGVPAAATIPFLSVEIGADRLHRRRGDRRTLCRGERLLRAP